MNLTKAILLLIIFISGDAMAGWTKYADLPANGRHRATGIAIGNKGYIGLGHHNGSGVNIRYADWWEYDPASNTWTQKADYVGNNSTGVYAALAFGVGNFGYVGGGVFGSSNFYKYSPATNTWIQVSSLPVYTSDIQGFTVGSKCYYIDSGQLYEYDTTNDQWTVKNPPPVSGVYWNSTFTIQTSAYVLNGSSLYEYKPLTDQWISRASFPGLSSSARVGFTQKGKGYITTGFAGSLSNINSEVWEFDPQQNAWTQLPDFPGSSRRFSVGFTIGDMSYMGTGTNGTNFSDFWGFNSILETDEITTDIKLTCYPNPVTDYAVITTENLQEFDLEIVSSNGKVVYSEHVSENDVKIDCTSFTSGTYFYKITTSSTATATSTFIKK